MREQTPQVAVPTFADPTEIAAGARRRLALAISLVAYERPILHAYSWADARLALKCLGLRKTLCDVARRNTPDWRAFRLRVIVTCSEFPIRRKRRSVSRERRKWCHSPTVGAVVSLLARGAEDHETPSADARPESRLAVHIERGFLGRIEAVDRSVNWLMVDGYPCEALDFNCVTHRVRQHDVGRLVGAR